MFRNTINFVFKYVLKWYFILKYNKLIILLLFWYIDINYFNIFLNKKIKKMSYFAVLDIQ
jgi:hypothetical protein